MKDKGRSSKLFSCRILPTRTYAPAGKRVYSSRILSPPKALELFQYAVRCYPGSANAHDSLAEAYEAAGKFDLALESSRTACLLGERASDPRLPTFKKRLEGIEAKTAQDGRR